MMPDLSKVIGWPEFRKNFMPSPEEIALYREAETFLAAQKKWCIRILDGYVGFMHAPMVGVFLFHIVPGQDAPGWIWVIAGDIPPAYIITERNPTPGMALEAYINEMKRWVRVVRRGGPMKGVIPVNVPATKEWAYRLRSRLEFLEGKILSRYRHQLM